MNEKRNNRRIRIILAAMLGLAPLSVNAADAIVPFAETTGLTLTIEVRTSSTADISASLTEGTGDGAGWYGVDDAVLVAAGLNSAGVYSYTILNGSTIIREGTLFWSGSVALPETADATYWRGTAIPAPDTAGYPKVTIKDGTGTGEIDTTSGVAQANVVQFGSAAGTFAGGRPEVGIPDGALTAAKFASDFLTAAKTAADFWTEGVSAIGTGLFTDVNQENVPTSRVFNVVRGEAAGLETLQGEAPKGITVGEANTFAVDFRSDMPVNAKINSVDAVAITSGTAGGITFASFGRDKTLAKFRATAVTAGEYTVRVTVTYEGGAVAKATIEFTVAS